MGLQCGIVGLPNVGKSTLFNALSNAGAQSANYPFCTIEPNIGVVQVPDSRLQKLADLVNPQKIMPTTVEIVDIAGLVKGASKGEGLGNQFLGNIRSTDAIVHVIRCFDDDNITHVDGSVDPVRDKEVIDFELQLKDLDSIEKGIEKYKKQAKGADKDAQKGVAVLTALKSHIESGISARTFEKTEENASYIDALDLLTTKPVVYVCNVDEASAKDGNAYSNILKEAVKDEPAEVLIISAGIESEIAQLDTLEERQEFLTELGLTKGGVERMIQTCYALLNLITYFTAGEKEVRAWTIKKGITAPQAAGVIHTDFEKGFIRAEVISYDAYVKHGSESACRDAGKIAVEGKEYVVKDGDIMHFRFNV